MEEPLLVLHFIGELMPAFLLPRPKPLLGYSSAVLLAVLAQACRIPLHPATEMPFITYVPFMLLAIWYGGFWPGILTDGLEMQR